MRIMHVMAGAKEGGAENIMLESVLALAEAGLNQHVVTRPDNQFRVQKFREAGIGVDVAAFNNTWPFPTRRVIGDAIKAFKPDVIEYWMGRAGQFAQKEYRSRSIGWYGGYYKLARFVNCEWHVGLTIDLLRHIREQGVPDDRSAIIHTYADLKAQIRQAARRWIRQRTHLSPSHWPACTRRRASTRCWTPRPRCRACMSGSRATVRSKQS